MEFPSSDCIYEQANHWLVRRSLSLWLWKPVYKPQYLHIREREIHIHNKTL